MEPYGEEEFMFAGDFADALVKAAKNIKSLPDIMNCGLGFDFDVETYYREVAKIIGWRGRAHFRPFKASRNETRIVRY